MTRQSAQLLDAEFQTFAQPSLWHDEAPLRYVVKLHRATRLHYDFRLELYGRLFSLAVGDVLDCWVKRVHAVRVGDHDPRYLLNERRIPPNHAGAGPALVWDYGLYRTAAGSQADVYRQLQQGCLEIEVSGVRLDGRIRLTGRGRNWRLERLSGHVPYGDRCVLTGRTLEEIDSLSTLHRQAFRLWLEWEHYYTRSTVKPEVVVSGGKVVDLNFAAKVKGVSVGMRLQHVLPLVPGCQVRDLENDSAKQRAWLDLVNRYTDVIQPVEPHSAVADLSDHPDAPSIVAKIVAELADHPFGRLRYGVGSSTWLAGLAARQSDPYRYLVEAGKELSPQTVANLLAVAPKDRERLDALGLHTIGDVARAPSSALRAQFGDAAHHIALAAQGKSTDTIAALYPPGRVSESIVFESPTNDALRLQEAVEELAERLANRLSGRQAGSAFVIAELEDGSRKTISRSYKRGVYSQDQVKTSLNYLAGQLQRECPDIVRVTTQLDQLEPLKSSQQDMFLASNRPTAEVVLETLQNSMGKDSVLLAGQMKSERRVRVLSAWRNATGWN